MDLIHFHELNCYHACIINALNLLEINHAPAFATLWSETDFSYNPRFHMYLTKRLHLNLNAFGVTLQALPCASGDETRISFAGLEEKKWFIAGMDAFYMPWTQYYQTLNSYHYFLGQKKTDGSCVCFDPTYNTKNILIQPRDILPYIFDFICIDRHLPNPIHTGVIDEARQILNVIPQIQKNLIEEIKKCTGENRSKANNLAIYTSALHTNRCLYRHYLQQIPKKSDCLDQLFSEISLKKWNAVKHGLYKASLVQANNDILEQVCTKLNQILDEEIIAAKRTSTLL